MPQEDKPTTIQGTLERITFHSEENGYTVARLQSAKGGGELTTIVGHFSGIPVGSTLSLSGFWVKDARHGRQFKVQHYSLEKPNTLNGIERYLGSGLVKGVGPGFASRIVKKFGLQTLDVLEKDPERLCEVQGLGEKRIVQIKTAWQEQKNIHEIMVFLQGHNISAAFAVKIFKTYGASALQVVVSNPYRLAEDIWGIAFKSADRIALSMGIPLHDSRRARAALLFVLGEAAGNGHCYIPQPDLVSQCRHLLDPEGDLDGLGEMISAEIVRLAADGKIASDEGCVYLAPLYYAEQGVASSLALLARPRSSVPSDDLDKILARMAEKMAVTFALEQHQALKTALENRVAIITGGPGTGKSTILKGLIQILSTRNVRVDLAAPTGRAAKRLGEACGREAKTIHRLLEYDPSLRGFRRGSDNPLESDFVVVDEASMMDIVLANSLFKSISPGASLLLVGDVDQLPSVGPGNVLRDCIESRVFPLVRLTRIYRQSEGSLISVNAGRINCGEFLELLPDYKGDKDFYFIKRNDPQEIVAEINSLCGGRLQNKYGFDPLRDIQILTPMRKGIIGCDNLNQTLQQVCNPGRINGPSPDLLSSLLTGDKVMQIRNNYDKEVFNGDIGFIVRKNTEDQTVIIDFDGREVEYEKNDLTEIELAYAITVHKSQGSEFKCIIVPVHTAHYPLLQRNLLYTAITRGKELVIVIGSSKAVAMAIKNNSIEQRNSRLKEKLRK